MFATFSLGVSANNKEAEKEFFENEAEKANIYWLLPQLPMSYPNEENNTIIENIADKVLHPKSKYYKKIEEQIKLNKKKDEDKLKDQIDAINEEKSSIESEKQQLELEKAEIEQKVEEEQLAKEEALSKVEKEQLAKEEALSKVEEERLAKEQLQEEKANVEFELENLKNNSDKTTQDLIDEKSKLEKDLSQALIDFDNEQNDRIKLEIQYNDEKKIGGKNRRNRGFERNS